MFPVSGFMMSMLRIFCFVIFQVKPRKIKIMENYAWYKDWKMSSIWRTCTCMEKNKEGGAVAMSLKRTAQETVKELDTAVIHADDGEKL